MVVRYNHQRKGSFDVETIGENMGIELAKRLIEIENPSDKLIEEFTDVAIHFGEYGNFLNYLEDHNYRIFSIAFTFQRRV